MATLFLQVKIWFQNRRMKSRLEQEKQKKTSTSTRTETRSVTSQSAKVTLRETRTKSELKPYIPDNTDNHLILQVD